MFLKTVVLVLATPSRRMLKSLLTQAACKGVQHLAGLSISFMTTVFTQFKIQNFPYSVK